VSSSDSGAVPICSQTLPALPTHNSYTNHLSTDVCNTCRRCCLLAVGLCIIYSQMLPALPTHNSCTNRHVSHTCHKRASYLLQVSSFGSGALHPMWLKSSCKAACTAKLSRCHPAMVSSKTSSHLLLSMLPRSLRADHRLLDASQVPDLTCSSCSSHMHSPMHYICMVPVIKQLV
jgi:hypothetical protein